MLCWREDTCVANAASYTLTHESDDLVKVGISKVDVRMLFDAEYYDEMKNTLTEIPQLFEKLNAAKEPKPKVLDQSYYGESDSLLLEHPH